MKKKQTERGYRCEIMSDGVPFLAHTIVAKDETDAANQMLAIGHALTLPGDTVRVQALGTVREAGQ